MTQEIIRKRSLNVGLTLCHNTATVSYQYAEKLIDPTVSPRKFRNKFTATGLQ